jgi:predicted lipid-binding transport protein (Tim44 family)
MKLLTLILTLALALTGMNAEAARRLGGGKSVGQQSSNVTKQAAPAAPAAPANAQNAAKPAAPAAPAVAPRKPWGAMLGGLAAGLGLAWLAHSLGLGEAFGNILMFGLLALGLMMAFGWFMRRRAAQSPNRPNATPFAFEGASAGAAPTSMPPVYRPENVGNDASARPWERSIGMPLDAGQQNAGLIGSGLTGSQSWGIPADFDTAGFLSAAKGNFITLQAAWDKSDINALRVMMTDGMLSEIQTQLSEREVHTGGPFNHTEVVMIDAKLLGIEDLAQAYMASVEFSGMIKEDPSSGPSPFREVWNMTKPKSGATGWLVAGVQALQ